MHRAGRIVLTVALVTAAVTYLILAWTLQYGFVIPMIYVGRMFRAFVAMGVYAFLLFVPVIGWIILGGMIVRRGPIHRPIPWRPRAHWPQWARV